jgi:hypothetical protein
MKRSLVLYLAAGLLFSTVHRLPAPISEESPTPVPEQTAKPKPKRTIKPNANESSEGSKRIRIASPTPFQKRFAGTWKGKLDRGSSGIADITVVVNATESSVTESGFFPGPQSGPAKITGNAISWNWMLASWTMTLNQDGRTAQIVVNSPFGTSRGTLEKSRLTQ